MAKPLNKIYHAGFFKGRHRYSSRAIYISKGLLEIWHPKTFIDAGCATGDVVKKMLESGVDAYGIEGATTVKPYLVIPEDKVIFADLGIPLNHNRRYDLCYTVEVAEHIEPECAETYLDNICALSDNVLFTAAPPGQPGTHHVNCQPKEYWVEKFNKRGYVRDEGLEEQFKQYMKPMKGKRYIRMIYMHNLIVFRKEV